MFTVYALHGDLGDWKTIIIDHFFISTANVYALSIREQLNKRYLK